MTIVCAMLTLDYAGVPTYVLTLSRELKRRGHRVVVYCPREGGGPMAPLLDVVRRVSELPEAIDAILVHHRSLASSLRDRFRGVPMIFVAHGVFSPESAPPDVPVDRYVAINEQTAVQLVEYNVPMDRIDLVRDFVDVDRFHPASELRKEKPRVLFLSNYKRWNNYFFAFDACAALGLPFRAVGSPYGRSVSVERDINEADVVLSWGRGVLEAMACGRAVISYDQARLCQEDMYTTVTGDGYLTIGRYFISRQRNFGPVGCCWTFSSAVDVARELRLYDPADGEANRALALLHHGHVAGVDAVLASIEKARASCS